MAMSIQAMHAAIKAEYDDVTKSINWKNGERPEPLAYTKAFDRGLTEYVESNMDITYDWAAKLPHPASTADPTESFKSELIIADKTIGQPPVIATWGPLIMACFAKTVTKHPAAFKVQPGKLGIKPLVINPAPGEYPGPLLSICTQIYNWLLTCIDPAPLSGDHGAYSGATTGMVIQ
ncbi:hypothetical protein AGMMS50268_09460 [Spirochaetia bacterium]|nr:hypothetical protein AGMMS50268_09460 [Spirochaetia bacterium]